MTAKELLIPRYKVIADYPNNDVNPVGNIINCTQLPNDFDEYPHLFKKLEWWQERDLKDMPTHIKHKYTDEDEYHLSVVEKWGKGDKDSFAAITESKIFYFPNKQVILPVDPPNKK